MAVVKDDAGVFAVRMAIGREELLHLRATIGHARKLVRHRARRAYRRARAAAHAQVRIDLDVVAVGKDRLRRADLDARIAAGDLRAAVRADALAVGEIARLLEFADAFENLVERLGERALVGARVVVALRRLAHGEAWLRREIEDEIE